MNRYTTDHGLRMHCKTCHKEPNEEGYLMLIDGECEECNNAYLESMEMWEDDAVS